MKKSFVVILLFAILFLFFIQAAGTLVESIYILDLMNSKLDANVAGIVFFFTPVLLIPFYRKFPRGLVWLSFAVLFIARGILPYLKTAPQMLAAGLGTFASLSLMFLLLRAKLTGETRSRIGLYGSAGLALAVGLSVFLRTLEYSLDYSLTRAGGCAGWVLGLCLGWLLLQLDPGVEPAPAEKKPGRVTSPILGLILLLALVWFAFSAPAVIARWTEGNYTLIVLTVSLLALAWVAVSVIRPGLLDCITPLYLLYWNIAFTLSLTATILAHRVLFPPTPDSAAVTVYAPHWSMQIPLVLMLLLFPVVFLDLRLFFNQIRAASPAPRQFVPGILLGALLLILLIFSHIFTNVWGYVKPVSPLFRNLFWLPYFAMAGIVTLLAWRGEKFEPETKEDAIGGFHWAWALLLGALFIGTFIRALPAKRVQVDSENRTSLMAMTFNIQQANDDFGERSYERQLALIRSVSPDILSLQETDSTRISLNNNDYVRYYAEKLGYYSYFGPSTVTGTYGTSILSKYPLLNTHTVFTYSDKDEIGTAEAEIEVNGIRFTVIDVHPDGSDTAMLVFAKALLERTQGKYHVIALGDYNLRDYEEAYKLINSVFINTWTSVYPSKISEDGIDMSGENRIDHIFLSPDLNPLNPVYILPPDSATDHAVHWTEITW
jgi:endonuclease/exonuclease/phosphatase family metal-dependent hydrolase